MSKALKVILILVPLWALSGLMVINTDEVGLIARFGALNRVESSGLRFRLPWPIEGDQRLQVTEVKTIELDKRLALTGDANLVEVQANVQYIIVNPIDYTTQSDAPNQLLRAISEGALSTKIGRVGVDPDSFINRSKLQQAIKSATQKKSDELKLGMRIEAVEIQELNAPSQVIDAFYDLSSARGDKETLILSAKTYRSKLMPDSRGKASSLVEKAKADAKKIQTDAIADTKRFEDLLETWKDEPQAVKDRAISAFWKKAAPSLNIMPVTKETEVYLESKP